MKLRHIGIVVTDLEEAVKWYGQFNYYPLEYESVEIAGRTVQLCKLAHIDGSIIELLDGATAKPHISVNVGKLLFESLKSNYDMELFEKEGVCYIQDPWGNYIEIVEQRGF